MSTVLETCFRYMFIKPLVHPTPGLVTKYFISMHWSHPTSMRVSFLLHQS